jgi:hypothetical protein
MMPNKMKRYKYELWMFLAVGQALTAPLQMTESLRDALIESFVIHLRNLIDFFYPRQVQADDVIAMPLLKPFRFKTTVNKLCALAAAVKLLSLSSPQ